MEQQLAAAAARAGEQVEHRREEAQVGAAGTTRGQREHERQRQQRQQQLRQRMQEWGQGQPGERSFTSSSSSSPSSSSSSSSSAESGNMFGGFNTAAPRAGAREEPGAMGGGGGAALGARPGEVGGETTWACNVCTFLNDLSVSRCEMCGTRMSPQQRPPDTTYQDTLIGAVDTYTAAARNRRRRLAGTAGEFEAAAEEARCRLVTQATATRGGGLSTSGGDTGGRVATGGSGGDDDDGLIDTGGAISGAAAGSALGALGAGMLSAFQPGARPSRVIASILQGAFVGGVAGAALGAAPDLPGEVGNGTNNSDRAEGGGTSFDERRRQRRRQLALELMAGPAGGLRTAGNAGGAVSDLESFMLAQRLEELNLFEEAAAMRRERMLETVEGPRGIVTRRRWPAQMERQHQLEQDEDSATRPASATAIASLPQETVTADSLSHLNEDNQQCCICLEHFGVGEGVKRLQCLHLYHTICIDNWLQTSGTCPQCKHRVD